ncbi:MAG: biotin--[acetyl-CoA-carboxylase] ligase, partial [Pseudomonadota bacterium]
MRLDPAAVAAGFRLMAYETLGSTNAKALAHTASHGETSPLWITARAQSAGRGRGGKPWMSPLGNLYATLLLMDPALPDRAPELSFVAALAAYDAILQCAPGLRASLALKWPNDILCAGAKLAGILIESQMLHGRRAIAIGIGANCLHHPIPTSYPATDLAAAGAEVSSDELFFMLSRTMVSRLKQWNRGENFVATRADWLDRASGIGGRMRVRLPGRELFG